jgi:hypothetical protein
MRLFGMTCVPCVGPTRGAVCESRWDVDDAGTRWSFQMQSFMGETM